MGLKQSAKKGFLSKYNLKRWVNMEGHLENVEMIKQLYSDLAPKQQEGDLVVSQESFADCVKRLGLSEADLKKRMHAKYLSAVGYLCLSFLLLLYTIYVFNIHHLFSVVICVALFSGVLLLSISEHYGYFQLKRRQFSVSIKEWLYFLCYRDNS